MDDKMVQILCEHCGCVIAEVTQAELDELLDGDGFKRVDSTPICVYAGEAYCNDCASDRFEECHECGELIDKSHDDYGYDQYDRIYCESCCENSLSWCDHCERYHTEETTKVYTRHGEEYWCDDCLDSYAFYCDHCEDYFQRSYYNNYDTVDGSTICEDCASRYFIRCETCGDYVFNDDAIERNGDYYCENCVPDLDDELEDVEINYSPEVIHSYHGYPSDWKFRNEQTNGVDDNSFETYKIRLKQLHIGPELEIDDGGCRNDKAIAITTALGFPANESTEFKCSRDGSLNNGFEIIAMPATYEWHTKHYNWEAGLQKARELGYKSHDCNTCGLHFHVDRAYFTDSMVNPEEGFVIITTNNMNWLKAFSRRSNYSYCRFIEGNPFTAENFKEDVSYYTQGRLDSFRNNYRGHNVALNFSNNATIELRFVRGTLKYSTFKAAFQLVEMMSYAVKHFRKEQLTTVNLQWFKRFAEKRSYTEFLTYIQERGIMS